MIRPGIEYNFLKHIQIFFISSKILLLSLDFFLLHSIPLTAFLTITIIFQIFCLAHALFFTGNMKHVRINIIFTGFLDFSATLYIAWNLLLSGYGFILIIILFICILINSTVLNSKIFRIEIYVFAACYLLIIYKKDAPLTFFFSLVFTVILAVFDFWYRYYSRSKIQTRIADLHLQIDVLRSKNDIISSSINMSLHDINNDITALFYQIELFHIKKLMDDGYFQQLEQRMNRIRSQLQHIRTSAKASFNISDLIHEISREMKLETAFLHIDASCSKTITFDLKIIRSIIFNLLDNSIKAFLKKYGTLRHLGIKIMMSDFTMIYEDNCGGCDINELKGGIISEEPEPGHGYFNFYLLKKGYIFNIDADVERTSSGLRYKITFKT